MGHGKGQSKITELGHGGVEGDASLKIQGRQDGRSGGGGRGGRDKDVIS